jgi:hypothetical protein
VPVDPADVRKVVLEEPPGNLPVSDERVTLARARPTAAGPIDALNPETFSYSIAATELPYWGTV